MKKCPYCAEEIQDEAVKCKHCGEILDGSRNNSKKVIAKHKENIGCGTLLVSFLFPGFGHISMGFVGRGILYFIFALLLGFTVIGYLIMGVASIFDLERLCWKCPKCMSFVEPEVKICKHCQTELVAEKSTQKRKPTPKETLISTISEYVFTYKGKKLNGIRTSFKNALKKANIKDFRFHDLRHTFASYLAMEGVDLYVIKELLGHKRIEMTMRYAHLNDKYKAQSITRLDQRWEDVKMSLPEKLSYSDVIEEEKSVL